MFTVTWAELIDHAKASGGIPYLKRSIERYQESLKRYKEDYKERKSQTIADCIEIVLEDIARERKLIRLLQLEIAQEKKTEAKARANAKEPPKRKKKAMILPVIKTIKSRK